MNAEKVNHCSPLKFTGQVSFYIILTALFSSLVFSQNSRTFSGAVLPPRFETAANVSIEIQIFGGIVTAKTDAEGAFPIAVPAESLSVKFSGNNIELQTRVFASTENLQNV